MQEVVEEARAVDAGEVFGAGAIGRARLARIVEVVAEGFFVGGAAAVGRVVEYLFAGEGFERIGGRF